MRWKLNPSSFVKTAAASLSVFTMTLAPVAQGAEAVNQRKMVNEYLKTTGLTTKKMTVGEYWRMVRHVYPGKLQAQMDQWVQENRNEMMPSIEATSFKDKNNVEQVRLNLSRGSESANITFTGDEEVPLKYNGVSITKKDLGDYSNMTALMEKVAKADPQAKKNAALPGRNFLGTRVTLTLPEFKKLTIAQKAEYLVRMRYAAESASKVYQVHYGLKAYQDLNSKHQWAYQFLFGQQAFAVEPQTGQPCIVAGYLTQYGENGRCGGDTSGWQHLQSQMSVHQSSCPSTAVACNPIVYGYKGDGSTFCVDRQPRSTINFATAKCNGDSPLNGAADKKRIIESFLKKFGKNVDLKIVQNANGQDAISPDQYAQVSSYLEGLNAHISNAEQKCQEEPLVSIKGSRDEQNSACEELMKRAMDLKTFITNPGDNCAAEMPGSTTGPNGRCVCPEGTRQQTKDGQKTCVVVGGGSDCGFWCRNKKGLLVLGIAALGVGLFWYLSKDKSKAKPPVYIPPEPGTTTSPTTTPTTPGGGGPIDPPPAPCPAPNYMVNGVCTPPVIVPPGNDTSEGGTKTGGPSGGGVR